MSLVIAIIIQGKLLEHFTRWSVHPIFLGQNVFAEFDTLGEEKIISNSDNSGVNVSEDNF